MAEETQQKDKKSKRKIIITLLIIITIIIILLLLMRCGGKKKLEPVVENEPQTTETVTKLTTGFVPATDKTITPELKELFDKATSKDPEANYVPVELIAKQENEDSTDYKFLAESTSEEEPDKKNKFIIVIREDIGGDVSVTNVEPVSEPEEDEPNKKTIVVDDGKAATTYYLVVFRDQYGNELQRSALPYGATPSYNGWLPEGFSHWDKEISPVTGNVNYYAVCYEEHHSEPSVEPVTPVTPEEDYNFLTNSLYTQTYNTDQLVNAVFTTYEDDNTTSLTHGFKIALFSYGPATPPSQRTYVRCAYEVDTSSDPQKIILYTNPAKKPSETEATKIFTIEIGENMTLKNFPTNGNDVVFTPPVAPYVNFFSVDQTNGYAYQGNKMIWLLARGTNNIVINGTSNVTKIGDLGTTGEYFTRYFDSNEYLVFGPSITEIGEDAFLRNTMVSIDFTNANDLLNIKGSAFAGCPALQAVSFPDSLRAIGDRAFSSCGVLTTIELKEGLITISKEAFSNSSITSVSIPSTVTTIGDNAFHSTVAGSGLTSLTFAGTPSIKSIGAHAFQDKEGNIELNIPISVEKLGLKCFYNFDPTKITIDIAGGFKTQWILHSKDGNEIETYNLNDSGKLADFIKGLIGDDSFSKKDNFPTDENLGYFQIVQQIGPVG